MYPSTTKFQPRPSSPQFPNISPPEDYPPPNGAAMASMGAHGGPIGVHHHNHHHHQHMMQQQQQQHQQQQQAQQQQQQQMGHPLMMRQASKTLSGSVKSRGGAPPSISQSASMSSTLGHHRAGDLMFPDELDTIEFCMPPPPATAGSANGHGHTLNGDMMLMHGSNGLCSGIAEAFTERRRRGHSRRSNHKMDVEQQVKWTRKNIAATMERFEPTAHSSSSTSSLEYGFAAGVVTPAVTAATPLHQPPHISPTHMSVYPSTSHGAVGGNNHVYSYAYYEPGAAKCHTNVPQSAAAAAAAAANGDGPSTSRASKSPPRNSIRALLAKGFRSKSNSGQSSSSSPSTDERHTYTTRYGTTENLYEEVNEQKIRKVLSDNRIATSSAATVKEELRRVQHNHFRVLDELNLSLEALIMPPTPPDVSPNHADDDDGPNPSGVASGSTAAVVETLGAAGGRCLSASSSMSQRPRRGGLLGGASSSTSSTTSSQQRTLSHASLENLSSTLHSMELKDHAHSSCINPDFDEGDLDSGFSGSGSSSGASYNESLRYYAKSNGPSAMAAGLCHPGQSPHTTTLPHNLRSCRSSTASGTSTSKSSMASADEQHMGMMPPLASCSLAAATMGHHAAGMSPFNFGRRCSDSQRASTRSAATIGSIGNSMSTATGTKPKKNFWTIKP